MKYTIIIIIILVILILVFPVIYTIITKKEFSENMPFIMRFINRLVGQISIKT